MLTIIPLFLVGRYYYQLAHEHNRKTWGYAILGVGIAIASYILFAFGTGVVAALTGNLQWLDSSILISIIAMAFAIFVAFVVYKAIEKNWSRNPKDKSNPNLLDN